MHHNVRSCQTRLGWPSWALNVANRYESLTYVGVVDVPLGDNNFVGVAGTP